MDEILTRWATDLAKHQKEFQKQAMQVAEWDRILVDNTDKIGKLLAKTFQAERDASEVEKQLSGVESQQEELDQYLDRYEKEVDDMIQKHGLTQDNAGLDIERERTYVVTPSVDLLTIAGTNWPRSLRTASTISTRI
jgi:nuclear pore complex protein Nup62